MPDKTLLLCALTSNSESVKKERGRKWKVAGEAGEGRPVEPGGRGVV